MAIHKFKFLGKENYILLHYLTLLITLINIDTHTNLYFSNV